MNKTVADIITVLEDFAPTGLAENWDAVGLQVGAPQQACKKVGLALDLTKQTLQEALNKQVDLIVVHHPLLFRPVKAIRFDEPMGTLLQTLCAKKIGLYAAHTNLDSTVGGLNDYLADQIDLRERRSILPQPDTTPAAFRDTVAGLGRAGSLPEPTSLGALANKLNKRFKPAALRIIGDKNRIIETVAMCTGSGGALIAEAATTGADCYITGDVKYHQALDAEAIGLSVLDVGHFATEITCISILEKALTPTLGQFIEIVSLTSAQDPLQSFK